MTQPPSRLDTLKSEFSNFVGESETPPGFPPRGRNAVAPGAQLPPPLPQPPPLPRAAFPEGANANQPHAYSSPYDTDPPPPLPPRAANGNGEQALRGLKLSLEPTRPVFAERILPLAKAAWSKIKEFAPLASSPSQPEKLVRTGLSVVGGFLGFMVVGSSLASVDSAVISFGIVGAEGSRKAVQHLDGGIISAILVKEGEVVTSGQEIIRLDQVQPKAALEIQSSQVETQLAVIARLEAESDGRDTILFPVEIESRQTDPSVRALMASQIELFGARKTALETQIGTIGEQINQAKSQMQIFETQMQTADKQYKMINEELAPKEMLYEKGYATNSPVLQLKRAATAVAGQKQEASGQIARLSYMLSQLENQIEQIKNDYRLKVAQELEDARNKLQDARERERVARDVLDRTVIRAPVSGRVLGLSVNTIGGVVGKGEKLLEIVPNEGGITIKARFKQGDGIEIEPGMKAELRILSAQGRRLPLVYGEVRNRSADARLDQATQVPYFDVEVALPEAEARALEDVKLTPGTPVEIIIPTGSRTVISYMLEPLTESLRHGMREQ